MTPESRTFSLNPVWHVSGETSLAIVVETLSPSEEYKSGLLEEPPPVNFHRASPTWDPYPAASGHQGTWTNHAGAYFPFALYGEPGPPCKADPNCEVRWPTLHARAAVQGEQDRAVTSFHLLCRPARR